jgi:hypothetical protein
MLAKRQRQIVAAGVFPTRSWILFRSAKVDPDARLVRIRLNPASAKSGHVFGFLLRQLPLEFANLIGISQVDPPKFAPPNIL